MQKAGPGHLWVWHPAVRGKHSPRSSSVRCQVREDLLNLRAAQLSSSAGQPMAAVSSRNAAFPRLRAQPSQGGSTSSASPPQDDFTTFHTLLECGGKCEQSC